LRRQSWKTAALEFVSGVEFAIRGRLLRHAYRASCRRAATDHGQQISEF
jgi:hypothetical protein